MSEHETLEEWKKKYSAVQHLEKNLKANLDAMTNLRESEKRDLMRLNMIMVRQFAQDCGLE